MHPSRRKFRHGPLGEHLLQFVFAALILGACCENHFEWDRGLDPFGLLILLQGAGLCFWIGASMLAVPQDRLFKKVLDIAMGCLCVISLTPLLLFAVQSSDSSSIHAAVPPFTVILSFATVIMNWIGFLRSLRRSRFAILANI